MGEWRYSSTILGQLYGPPALSTYVVQKRKILAFSGNGTLAVQH
jgi:hypothetical protein